MEHMNHTKQHQTQKKPGLVRELNHVFLYMKQYRALVFVALAMAAIGAVAIIIGPDQIGKITDYMSDGLFGEINLTGILHVAVTLLAIYLIGAVVTFVEQYIMSTVTLKTSKRMREELSIKINRVPQEYFGRTSQGDVLSRVTNDVSTLQQGLSNSLPTIISSSAQFVGCLIMMYVTEWRMATCAVIVTLLGLSLLMIITKHSQKHFIAKQERLGTLNGYVEEMYSGHGVVRISRAGGDIKDHFSDLNRDVYESNWKSQFLSGIMMPLMTAVGNIGYVAVCVLGSALAFNGTISFGVIVSFILYVRLFTSPLGQIAQGLTNLQTAVASAHRIFEFLDEEELSDESEKQLDITRAQGDVSFKQVTFAYPSNPEKTIIKGFSVDVKAGQKVAIVGPTGAGKTTMVNLLMRFFETTGGEITIDGTPITAMRRDQVHSQFAMVLQDTWLFEGTLRENLLYNMRPLDDETLKQILHFCGLDHFLETLPNGLDTVLSEATSISAGQKQLLTIARAMAQNSPMLILDEATSSVDTRTELLIQKAMDELTRDRTSFVIAHRLSTIRNADLILVMKDGDIIESGNHDELMEKNGFYAELYNSQFQQTA